MEAFSEIVHAKALVHSTLNSLLFVAAANLSIKNDSFMKVR